MFTSCCRSVERHVDSIDIEQVFEVSRQDNSSEQECQSEDFPCASQPGKVALVSPDERPADKKVVEAQDQLCRERSWKARGGSLFLETEERGAACGGASYSAVTAAASTASCPSSRSASDFALSDEEIERQREIEHCEELGVLLLPEDDEDSEVDTDEAGV
mmetsp:Transcript_36676/g.85328  ORF Transcript_36676/g.85328 Transcript_36676/m.85328 type:complete len:161 (-) Transcript_36676:131-613(-)